MPYLKIHTNITPDTITRDKLLHDLSTTVAEQLGKPERYVMIAIEAGAPMIFGGDDGPLAYLELKSVGLPAAKTAVFSAVLCRLVEQELEIPADRIYIEFADADGQMWGWNGATF
jgi:phenylpyruvate tautomerase